MRLRMLAAWFAPALAVGLLFSGCSDANNDAVPDQAQNAPGESAPGPSVTVPQGTVAATKDAGKAVENTASNAAELGDNAVTTGKIKNALMVDKSVPASRINVNTKDDVVTLEGDVDTAAQKAKAEAIAKKHEGIKSVVNKLTVKGK